MNDYPQPPKSTTRGRIGIFSSACRVGKGHPWPPAHSPGCPCRAGGEGELFREVVDGMHAGSVVWTHRRMFTKMAEQGRG